VEAANSSMRDKFQLNEIATLPSRGLPGTVKLQFMNKQDGWLYNFNHLWRTSDGAKTWATVYDVSSNRDAGYLSVEFINAQVGWRCDINTLEKTIDGGVTWKAIPAPFKSNDGEIFSVQFLQGGRRGWLTGGLYQPLKPSQYGQFPASETTADGTKALQGVVFYTEDSGQSWRRQLIETASGKIVQNIVITPTGRAWTTAGYDTFYLEGNRWQKVDYGRCSSNNKLLLEAAVNGDKEHDFYAPLAIDFIDDSQGWLSFTNGYIAKTTDGGRTWCDLSSLKTSGSKSDERLLLHFINALDGLAVGGDGGLYETADGGTSWRKIETNLVIADIYRGNDDIWVASNEKLFHIALK
jgi:photosystem II stability/assembly factor-like uncharacterized protein